MALGVPPVAAGHGAFPELITPAWTACCSSPATPWRWERSPPKTRRTGAAETFGEKARKTYEKRFDRTEPREPLGGIYRFAIDHPI